MAKHIKIEILFKKKKRIERNLEEEWSNSHEVISNIAEGQILPQSNKYGISYCYINSILYYFICSILKNVIERNLEKPSFFILSVFLGSFRKRNLWKKQSIYTSDIVHEEALRNSDFLLCSKVFSICTYATCNLKQVLAATPHKTPTVRPPTPYHENYSS